MNPIELADQYLYPYKIKGNEIIPEYCPFCSGGVHRDKHTFALNIENGTYNCKRGKCNEKGSLNNLLKYFNIRRNNKMKTYNLSQTKKEYRRPEDKYRPVMESSINYLMSRGISKRTINDYRIKSDEKGNIVFPYYEDDKLVFVKYRVSGEIRKGSRKSWREPSTKPVLFGMHLCNTDDALCIFEGEIDAMSGYESGICNCVSVPSGANDLTWLDTCYDFINDYKEVYLFIDNDEAGSKLIDNLKKRLINPTVLEVNYDAKDANELLVKNGVAAVKSSYEKAGEIPKYGIKCLSSIKPLDFREIEMVPSGIDALDADIGGLMLGDISIWTGLSGSGKSTIAGQIMLEAAYNNYNGCIYSGELSPERVKYWMDLQLASSHNIESEYFENLKRSYPTIPQSIQDKARKFYEGGLFIYDNSDIHLEEHENIFDVFEYAYNRYSCRVFLVDNLMTAITPDKNRNTFEQQSFIIGELAKFARNKNVHIHVVSHLKKTNNKINCFDISGSADITNRAANVFLVEQISSSNKKTKVSILKNRWEGVKKHYYLNYCNISRRIYEKNTGDKDYFNKKEEKFLN
jgi:twinkle protein